MLRLEGHPHVERFGELDGQRGLRASISKRHPSVESPLGVGAGIPRKSSSTCGFEILKRVFPTGDGDCSEIDASRVALPMPFEVGDPHPKGGERARVRMEHELPNPQTPCHRACVLSARSAEDDHSVRADVVAAADGNPLNGGRHVLDGNSQESSCDFVRGLRHSPCNQRSGDFVQLVSRARVLERKGESIRRNSTEAQRYIGERQLLRLWVAVTQGARVCASARGSNDHSLAREGTNRPAARGNGMELDHRRANPYPRDLAFEHPGNFPAVTRHVGRCAPHVETDHFAEVELVGDRTRRYRPGGWSREDRVAADEV